MAIGNPKPKVSTMTSAQKRVSMQKANNAAQGMWKRPAREAMAKGRIPAKPLTKNNPAAKQPKSRGK